MFEADEQEEKSDTVNDVADNCNFFLPKNTTTYGAWLTNRRKAVEKLKKGKLAVLRRANAYRTKKQDKTLFI